MAYKDYKGLGEDSAVSNETSLKLHASGDTLNLPDDSYIRDAEITRDGMDLVLDGPNGEIIVEDYFAGAEAPDLVAPGGATLTPALVNSFSKSQPFYAENSTMNDASPIGAVQEISGQALITRTDGTSEPLSLGTRVFQGDTIETAKNSAVNIEFIDDSSFAVSEESRLSIDEYVFDAASEAGAQNFSVLKGVFVFTSGLIGRDDPDDVSIDTPVGSIGIRGTIIAGDVNEGEITVVEGAIVLRTANGQELTLDNQFETGKFSTDGTTIKNLGQLSANDVSNKFSIVSKVSPTLFSSINDAAAENAAPGDSAPEQQQQTQDAPAAEENGEKFDADGATDQDGDNEVDGTVEEQDAAQGDESGGEEGQKQSAGEKDANLNLDNQDQINIDAALQHNTASAAINAEHRGANLNAFIQRLTQNAENPIAINTLEHLSDPNLINGGTSGFGTPTGNGFFIAAEIEAINEQTGNATLSSNLKVATLRSMNNIADTIDLAGSDAARFEIIETSAGSGTFEIFLKAGQQLDFESLQNLDLKYTAQATAPNGGTQVRTNDITLDINNVNEDPVAQSIANTGESIGFVTPEFTIANVDDVVTVDLGKLFYDQDLQSNLTFELDSATIDFLNDSVPIITNSSDILNLISGYSFDQDTGLLSLSLNSASNVSFSGVLENFDITLKATDDAGASSGFQTFTLTMVGDDVAQTLPVGSTLTSGNIGDVFTTDIATDLNTKIRSEGVSVFTSDLDDAIRIEGNGDNVNLNTAGGDDDIRVTESVNSNIITGSGDDRIDLNGNNEGTSVFAMDGSDTVNLNGAQIDNLGNNTFDAMHLDGGNGIGPNNVDTLGLDALPDGGNIDFTAILNNGHQITNFEKIDIDDNQANTIILSYDDVVAMTDDRGRLVLDVDDNDTVIFDSEGHGDSNADGTAEIDGGTHNVFQFDDVTLLINPDANVTIDGVVA